MSKGPLSHPRINHKFWDNGSWLWFVMVFVIVLASCSTEEGETETEGGASTTVIAGGGDSDSDSDSNPESDSESEADSNDEAEADTDGVDQGADDEEADEAADHAPEAKFVLEGELDLETAEVNDMIDFVEQVAGREFVRPPTIVAQTTADFEAGLAVKFGDALEDLDEDVEVQARLYQALGHSDQTPDELKTHTEAFLTDASAIAGYYEPEDDRVYMPVDAELDGMFRAILVHELTHALDGQYVDLGALIEDMEDNDLEVELNFVRAAIVEGRATQVQAAWMQTNGVAPAVPELSKAITDLPPIAVNGIQLPYQTGAAYIQAKGGAAGTWELYDEPPASSEHILFPNTPPSEPKVAVAPPTADGPELYRAEFGAADLALWLLGDSLQPDPATVSTVLSASDGWAGGEMVLWGDENDSCVRIALAADSAEDRAEIEVAARAWAEEGTGRSVSDDGETVLIEGCARFNS